MRRRTPSSLLLVALLTATSVSAAPPGLSASLTCRPEAAPGRVLCELRYAAAEGARLVWADALVTAAPDFVKPLRARVSPERFAQGGVAERKLSLGFVAARVGVGKVTVRARAVVCRGQGSGETCGPETRLVEAEIRVGS